MRLISLSIEPRGVTGLGSPTLEFGRVTSLFAPNGSGKTPLIQSIAFCLGYPILYREVINDKCEAATLVVEIGGRKLNLRRSIGNGFYVRVTYEEGDIKEFYTATEYSKAFFETLAMPLPGLVSTTKQLTHPFLETLLPLFYLDQDRGYADLYKAPKPFITDQAVEMVRFVFGLAPKHSFTQKQDLLKAKEDLQALDRKIVHQQKVVVDLSNGVDDKVETQQAVERQAIEFRQKLADVREHASLRGSASSALQELAGSKESAIRQTKQQMLEVQERIDGLASIRAEIATEVDTLGLNEEARRIFESFKDICGNPQCGLFLGSSESYAKNLLYLKDQSKDLERNADRASVHLEHLKQTLVSQQLELNSLVSKIKEQSATGTADDFVAAIEEFTKELWALERAKASIDILRKEKETLLRLQNERERQHDRIANLTSAGRSDHQFNVLRTRLYELIVKWLDILKTQHVNKNVDIDLDFKFKFGTEVFEAIKGSSKTRVVLAVHASIFELYLEDDSREFRFLILDTPKQHEIHTDDLDRYMTALHDLCRQKNGQVVISSTEYHYAVQESDREWLPSFPGEEHNMYLG